MELVEVKPNTQGMSISAVGIHPGEGRRGIVHVTYGDGMFLYYGLSAEYTPYMFDDMRRPFQFWAPCLFHYFL